MCDITIVTGVVFPYSTNCFDQPKCTNRGFDVDFIFNVLTIVGCKVIFMKTNDFGETLNSIRNGTANLSATVFIVSPEFAENFQLIAMSNIEDWLVIVTKKTPKSQLNSFLILSLFQPELLAALIATSAILLLTCWKNVGGRVGKLTKKFIKFLQQFWYIILGLLISSYSTTLTLKITQQFSSFDLEIKNFQNLVDAVSQHRCKFTTTVDYVIDELRILAENLNDTNPSLADRLYRSLQETYK